MDKLTRYNQRILAALGTLTFLALLVICLISLGLWIASLVNDYPTVDNTLQVTDSVQQQDREIRQLVSYLEPELADTVNNIYIIPVTQRTLDRPVEEKNLNIGLGKMGSYSSYEYSYGRDGSFNNIIIYNKNAEGKKMLFDQRINITSYFFNKVNERVFLFVRGAKGDTNNDGTYSNDDLENLYIYDLRDDHLHTISLENASYSGFQNLFGTDELVINFGIDTNKDGEFDRSREPIQLKHYSIVHDELTDFISSEMNQKIQKLVD